MIRQIEVLLLPADEERLAGAIQESYPGTVFVDERRWESADVPPAYRSVRDCGTDVAIWNPALAPVLPTSRRANGIIDGPQVGPVVQWIRSHLDRHGRLQSGRWAASTSDPDMIAFAKAIWKLLNAQTTNKLRVAGAVEFPPVLGRSERIFRVGREALEAARSGDLELATNRLRLVPE
jgi:hypothetical protein